jgi:hypothetical protein
MASASEDPGFTEAEYEIKLLLHKPKFQAGVLAIRKKWGIPVDGLPDNIARNAWQEKIAPRAEEYKNDVFLMMRELKLAERWYEGVSWYIQENMPGVLRVQPANPIRLQYDGDARDRKNVRSVWIQVDSDTTEREVLDAFKYARDLFGPLKKKQQPKNLDRDLQVLEMHRAGVKKVDIAGWLSSNYDGAFNTDDVEKILTRIKQKLE